jgi:serine/threonine protein kinase
MPEVTLDAVAKEICSAHSYSFISQVGSGAYKETFHVRTPSGASQALKVFRPGHSDERTAREINAMQRFDHPNISKLFSVARHQADRQEYLYCFEEYLSAGTLTQRVERHILSADDTRILGEALIRAVAHIASHDLVHRDLKPDNILFRDESITPVIVDFGLVRDLTESSLTQTWLMRGPGTPYFAAPEQLNNDKALIDWRTDQFALGVLLAMSMLGYHPFAEEQDTPVQVVERVARRGNPSRIFESDANRLGLRALVRMIAPWPAERFRTTEQLTKAWVEGGGTG